MRARLFLASVLALTILACTHQGWAWRNTDNSGVRTTTTSNMLDVPYTEQENSYFCGPAVVQMALGYISGDIIAQRTLAAEMKVTASEGTKSEMLSTPFTTRGYDLVSTQRGMNLDSLKEENLRGHVVIITILFDDISGIKKEFDPWTGITFTYYNLHYVVLTGYNSTGIFLNDPWNAYWYQPHGRETGKNAYVSNEMLAKILWNPLTVVPYSASPTYNVEIGISLERAPGTWGNVSFASKLFIDGIEEGSLKKGETKRFKFATATVHTISVDQYVSGTEGTRYLCPDYSLSVTSLKAYTFEYKTQYYAEVVSPYGTPNGSSWYDAGSTALLSVQPTEVGMPGLLGTMGGKYLLDHWTDSEGEELPICNRMSPGYCRVTVYSPMTVTVVWRDDLSSPYLVGSLAGTLLLFTLIAFVRWKARRTSSEYPESQRKLKPQRSWKEWLNQPVRAQKPIQPSGLAEPEIGTMRPTKFCRFCGAKILRDSKYCEECGARVV